MPTRLINRGEQICHASDLGDFEAQCAWSWTKDNHRTYPIYLSVRTVRFANAKSRRAVPKEDKRKIAAIMKLELEADEKGLVVELCD